MTYLVWVAVFNRSHLGGFGWTGPAVLIPASSCVLNRENVAVPHTFRS